MWFRVKWFDENKASTSFKNLCCTSPVLLYIMGNAAKTPGDVHTWHTKQRFLIEHVLFTMASS